MQSVDQKLFEGILRGNKRWLERFYRGYQGRLMNFVCKKIGDPHDAEEIVQDTFLSAILCLPSFSGKSSLWTWICAIARHEIADFYRKKKIKIILFSRLPSLKKIVDKALSPEIALEEKELKEKIVHCFINVTEGYREVLRLKYIEGFSVKQIAGRLGKTTKAVEMRLRRARLAYVQVWNDSKMDRENFLALGKRDISFLEECMGIMGTSIQDDQDY